MQFYSISEQCTDFLYEFLKKIVLWSCLFKRLTSVDRKQDPICTTNFRQKVKEKSQPDVIIYCEHSWKTKRCLQMTPILFLFYLWYVHLVYLFYYHIHSDIQSHRNYLAPFFLVYDVIRTICYNCRLLAHVLPILQESRTFISRQRE